MGYRLNREKLPARTATQVRWELGIAVVRWAVVLRRQCISVGLERFFGPNVTAELCRDRQPVLDGAAMEPRHLPKPLSFGQLLHGSACGFLRLLAHRGYQSFHGGPDVPSVAIRPGGHREAGKYCGAAEFGVAAPDGLLKGRPAQRSAPVMAPALRTGQALPSRPRCRRSAPGFHCGSGSLPRRARQVPALPTGTAGR